MAPAPRRERSEPQRPGGARRGRTSRASRLAQVARVDATAASEVGVPALSSMSFPVALDEAVVGTLLRSMGFATGLGTLSWLPFAHGPAYADRPDLDDAYKREAWVSACVDLRCNVIAAIPLRVYDGDPDDENTPEVTAGPIFELLRKPVRGLDQQLFQIVMSQHIDLTGECLLFMRDADGGPVVSYGDPADPDALIDLPDQIVPIRGDLVYLDMDWATLYPWRWRVAMGLMRGMVFPANAVVNVFEHVDPARSPWRGLGRLAKAFDYASQNYVARRYQSHVLRNNGTPSGVIELLAPQMPTEEAKRRMEAELAEEWDDTKNAGKTRILYGGAKYNAASISPKDMEYGKLLEANEEKIAAVFSTPGALLGKKDENYATFSGHMQIFLAGRVVPYLRTVAHAINQRILARLRDPKLRRQRVRFDTEEIERAFMDVALLAERAKALLDIGVPLGVALKEAGMKFDQFEGDEIAMVPRGSVPRDALIMRERAEAAIWLQDAGVPGPDSFELVGLPREKYVEPVQAAPTETGSATPPVNPMREPAPPLPPGESPDKAPGKALDPARGAAVRRLALGGANDRFASRGARIEEWRRLQRLQAPHRNKLRAAARRTFWAMRKAQLAALDEFAATGKVARAAGAPALRLYPDPAPTLPAPALAALLAALAADEAAAVPDAAEVFDCCGTRLGIDRGIGYLRIARDDWARRYPSLARRGIERITDLALLSRMAITEAQIDEILVAADRRWAELLAHGMQPVMVAAFQTAAEDLAAELGEGVDVLDMTDPAILKKIADRAIKVAEGSTSAVARRLRSELIDVLSKHGDAPTLQQAVIDALTELRATTTRGFNSLAARALTIARTETGIAANSARFDLLTQAWRDGIIAGLRWLTSGRPPAPEGTVRPWHYVLDGATTIPDVPFVTGHGVPMRFPMDPGGPADEICNCECSLLAVSASEGGA